MGTLNVLKTLMNFKDNFENIKTKENFEVDPLLKYDPDDLSSYDNKRKRYFAVWPSGKRETKNSFFEDLDKTKCNDSIFNRKCFTELKSVIWILLFAAIFMTIIFFIFMIYKVFKSQSSKNVKSVQTVQQPVQQTVQQTAQLPIPDSSDDSSFLKKLLKTKSVTPEVMPQQPIPASLNPPQPEGTHHNFFDRLTGSKSSQTLTQPPASTKADFMSRLIGAKSQ